MQTFRSRPADIGRARSRILAQRYGQELRTARVAAGLTQRQVASRASLSQQVVSKAERGDRRLSLDVRCQLAAAVGHEMAVRLFPVASIRLRDSGQLALARHITDAAHRSWLCRLEVPIAPADARATDLVLELPSEVVHIEIERGLVDLQAQLRAAELKRHVVATSETRPVRLVVAVPDSARSRAVVATLQPLLDRTLRRQSRAIWYSIRNGVPVQGDGVLFVRPAVRP